MKLAKDAYEKDTSRVATGLGKERAGRQRSGRSPRKFRVNQRAPETSEVPTDLASLVEVMQAMEQEIIRFRQHSKGDSPSQRSVDRNHAALLRKADSQRSDSSIDAGSQRSNQSSDSEHNVCLTSSLQETLKRAKKRR